MKVKNLKKDNTMFEIKNENATPSSAENSSQDNQSNFQGDGKKTKERKSLSGKVEKKKSRNFKRWAIFDVFGFGCKSASKKKKRRDSYHVNEQSFNDNSSEKRTNEKGSTKKDKTNSKSNGDRINSDAGNTPKQKHRLFGKFSSSTPQLRDFVVKLGKDKTKHGNKKTGSENDCNGQLDGNAEVKVVLKDISTKVKSLNTSSKKTRDINLDDPCENDCFNNLNLKSEQNLNGLSARNKSQSSCPGKTCNAIVEPNGGIANGVSTQKSSSLSNDLLHNEVRTLRVLVSPLPHQLPVSTSTTKRITRNVSMECLKQKNSAVGTESHHGNVLECSSVSSQSIIPPSTPQNTNDFLTQGVLERPQSAPHKYSMRNAGSTPPRPPGHRGRALRQARTQEMSAAKEELPIVFSSHKSSVGISSNKPPIRKPPRRSLPSSSSKALDDATPMGRKANNLSCTSLEALTSSGKSNIRIGSSASQRCSVADNLSYCRTESMSSMASSVMSAKSTDVEHHRNNEMTDVCRHRRNISECRYCKHDDSLADKKSRSKNETRTTSPALPPSGRSGNCPSSSRAGGGYSARQQAPRSRVRSSSTQGPSTNSSNELDGLTIKRPRLSLGGAESKRPPVDFITPQTTGSRKVLRSGVKKYSEPLPNLTVSLTDIVIQQHQEEEEQKRRQEMALIDFGNKPISPDVCNDKATSSVTKKPTPQKPPRKKLPPSSGKKRDTNNKSGTLRKRPSFIEQVGEGVTKVKRKLSTSRSDVKSGGTRNWESPTGRERRHCRAQFENSWNAGRTPSAPKRAKNERVIL